MLRITGFISTSLLVVAGTKKGSLSASLTDELEQIIAMSIWLCKGLNPGLPSLLKTSGLVSQVSLLGISPVSSLDLFSFQDSQVPVLMASSQMLRALTVQSPQPSVLY